MLKRIHEIAFGKCYRHLDKEIGLLKRVGGYWRVENPDIDVSVSIKIVGSNRFGPNRRALNAFKEQRSNIDSLWKRSKEYVASDLKEKGCEWDVDNAEFYLSEIIVGNPIKDKHDIAFAFQIDRDERSLYSSFYLAGKVVGYERLTYK